MSDKKTGGPAFPTQSRLGLNDSSTWITEIPGQPGMTLRDYFAAKALQGMFASGNLQKTVQDDELAIAAYQVADAMMKTRKL